MPSTSAVDRDYDKVRRKSQPQRTATSAASTGMPKPRTPTIASTNVTTAIVAAAPPASTSLKARSSRVRRDGVRSGRGERSVIEASSGGGRKGDGSRRGGFRGGGGGRAGRPGGSPP